MKININCKISRQSKGNIDEAVKKQINAVKPPPTSNKKSTKSNQKKRKRKKQYRYYR